MSIVPSIPKSVTQGVKVPARSVSAGGGVTPSSSKAITKMKQMGSNPNFMPKLATPYGPLISQDSYQKRDLSNYYKETIRDLKSMKNADRAKVVSALTALTGVAGSGIGAAKKNKSMKNYGLAVAGLGGLLHGMSSAVRSTTENKMNKRNKAIMEGFQKRAVLGGGGALGHGIYNFATGASFPYHAAAVSAVDVLTLPYLAEKGFQQMAGGVSAGLKRNLKYPLKSGQKARSGLVDIIGAGTSKAKEYASAVGKYFDQHVLGIPPVVSEIGELSKNPKLRPGAYMGAGTVDYLNKIPKAAVGSSGFEYAEKLTPIFKVLNELDPKITKQLIEGIDFNSPEGKVALRELQSLFAQYKKGVGTISKGFQGADNLKSMVSSKPGSSQQTLADAKYLYDTYLSPEKFEQTARLISDHIADLDKAKGTLNNYLESDSLIMRGIRALKPGIKSKDIGNLFDNPGQASAGAEKFVNTLHGVEDAAVTGTKALAIGVGSSALANLGTRAADKASSDKEMKEQISALLRRNK